MSRLFQKAKLAVKFRKAGEGHVLSESSTSTNTNQPRARQEPRKAPTSDAQRAGQAALARFNQQEKQTRRPQSATATWKSHSNEPTGSSKPDTAVDVSMIRKEVKTEIERESASNRSRQADTEVIKQDAAPVLAVDGVFFVCPFCSNSYGRRDIRDHMEECLRKPLGPALDNSKVKWEGAHHPYLQLGELNCEGRSSRGLVEGILKAPRAAALRPNREL